MKRPKDAGRSVAGETSAGPPPRLHAFLAGFTGLAVAQILMPTLAHTPQSGDGAEVVRVAVQGGVLHPPGFPLQAWIDRVLVASPDLQPAFAIAFFGLAAHAVTVGLLVAILGELGAGVTGALAAAAAFAFFPGVWRIAVQPEVFALPVALIAATLLFALRAAARPRARGLGETIGGGLAIGAGLAAHPIFLTVLPAAWAIPAEAFLKSGERRRAHVAALLATALLPPILLYASLPLLRTSSPWPDWGSLASAADVARHALRLEYGPLAFAAGGGADTLSGLSAWAAVALRVWNVALLVALFGLFALRRAGPARAAVVVAAAGAAAGLLALARLPFQSYSTAYLEKLDGPIVLAGAILFGLGVDALRRGLPRAARRPVDVVVALAAIAWLVTGWRSADAAHDRTVELHQQALAAELAPGWVYVTEGDVETFDGVPAGRGRRYPVMGPEVEFAWYWRNVAPRLEPRVLARGTPPPASWEEFLARCFARDLTVAATSGAILAVDSIVPELRGLLYVARPASRTMFTDSTVVAAVHLAPVAAALPVVPLDRTLSLFYQRRFARAFAGAAEALRDAGRAADAATADSAASAILRGLPAAERRARLDAFVRAAARTR